jgi:hypothetical protein
MFKPSLEVLEDRIMPSFVTTQPEALVAAAIALNSIGSGLSAHNASLAENTMGVVAAAHDEVSSAVAALFSAHAQQYEQITAQTAVVHESFVNTLGTSAGAFAAAEAANASPLQ